MDARVHARTDSDVKEVTLKIVARVSPVEGKTNFDRASDAPFIVHQTNNDILHRGVVLSIRQDGDSFDTRATLSASLMVMTTRLVHCSRSWFFFLSRTLTMN